MWIDQSRPENHPAIDYLRVDDWKTVEIALLRDLTPDQRNMAYWECFSHPEVVARVWDVLGKPLPQESCCLVNYHNCIVQDSSGILLAVCMGTEYVMRIAYEDQQAARHEGLKQSFDWSGGSRTNLVSEFGPDWFFGSFKKKEVDWMQKVYNRFAPPCPA